MSLTQLQAYYQPWLKKRSLKKDLLLYRKIAQKFIKSTVRKAKTQIKHNIRSQYYVTGAYADVKKAASRNEDIFITMIILAVVLSYSSAAISIDILITAFSAIFTFSEITKIDSTVFIAMACGSLAVIVSWLAAFTMNMQSIALMDGANRKRLNTVRTTIRQSLSLASRVTYSWLILGMIIIGIPLIAALIGSAYLSLTNITMLEMLAIVPYVITAGITWCVIMLMEYALLPYVMLFEPKISVRQAMFRSHTLIEQKGRIFLLFLYLLLSISLIGSFALAVRVESLLGVHRGLHFFGFSLVVLLIFNAVMTMFYRKRKLARK